jgi:hypothetical protein
MKPVERSEIVDFQTYNDGRAQSRPAALAAKALRRVVVSEHFTFLFENRDTVRYQVQEMMRAERIVRESDIEHELKTYNELLGGEGELGCTLLVTIDSEAERDVKLRAWLDLNGRLYAKLEDGTLVRPTFDARQVGDERLSSVQYLKFPVGPKAPVAIGVEGDAAAECTLSEEQKAALQSDLDA